MDAGQLAARISADKDSLTAYWQTVLCDLPVPSHRQWMIWLVKFGFSADVVRRGIDSVLTLQTKKDTVTPEDAVKYASATMHRLAKRNE